MNDQKNFILAIALSMLVIFGYFTFIESPTQKKAQIDAEREVAAAEARRTEAGVADTPKVTQPREALVTQGARIKIDTPYLSGSFLTTGSRLDDITLKTYDKTLDPADGQVELLSPEGGEKAAYVMDNWVATESGLGGQTAWSVVDGETLTPATPITLQARVGDVLVTRTLSIDDKFLLTLKDNLTNQGSVSSEITRVGVSRQHTLPDDLTNFFIIQEGPIAMVDGKYADMKYKKLSKKKTWSAAGELGWTGLTDKYWFQGAIAPQNKFGRIDYTYRTINDQPVYEAAYRVDPLTLTPGATVESTGYIYVGAKERDTLLGYEQELGIMQMQRAIDWGFLSILVKPISWALSKLGEVLGNYGLGILALTFIIKLLMFPLFNKQYASQAKMKKVAPKLKKIQARYKDDRMKLQKEMMGLYKKEGVNPAAGCLPIIPTIFVFFALYKSVFIDIDLRHEPFFGYIQDLSARDPLSIMNGFGLLPWGPEPFGLAFLAIGPLAILYGVSMSLIYTLTPQPTMGASDQAAMQAKIFKFMPWVLMFVLAPFAAGLLIYWVWNNILSFAQQYYITRKFKVDTPVDVFWRKITGKPEPEVTE